MKAKTWISALTCILLTVACGAGGASQPSGPGIQTVVAATLGALTSAAPNGISISFQNVSFVIPAGLASGAKSEVVPVATEANSDPWSVAPAHVLFTLTAYAAPTPNFDAVVSVYPAPEYEAVNSWAANSLTRLRGVLTQPGKPLTNDTLSTVPFYGSAAQEYAAQPLLLAFHGGQGVRMISKYGQAPGPVTRDGSFYHYEGLTSDGKYLVAVVLPVTLPLKSTVDNPSADGIMFPRSMADSAGVPAYFQQMTALLNAAGSGAFHPTLSELDALVASITVAAR
jgi:hypothetical protein